MLSNPAALSSNNRRYIAHRLRPGMQGQDHDRVILRLYLSNHRDLHLDPHEKDALCQVLEYTRAHIIGVALSQKLRESGLFRPLGADGRVIW